MQRSGLYANRRFEICRELGGRPVGSLRQLYGHHFAQGFPETVQLHEVFEELDALSVSALVHDHRVPSFGEEVQQVCGVVSAGTWDGSGGL